MVEFSVIDGHIDTVMRILQTGRKFNERSEAGHCDLPRMQEGNVQAALFAIFPAMTKRNILDGLDQWFKVASDSLNRIYQVKTIEDFSIAKQENKIGAVLHFEGAGGIDKKFQLLRLGYQMGLRTMGLSWSNVNRYATGSIFKGDQVETGLTDRGINLMEEAQKLGITIDVSHLNDLSFWDVIKNTSKPIIASHSNARAVCNHLRNLTDDQIKAVHEKKGTIGINYSKGFLLEMDFENPVLEVGLNIFKKHIDHIVNLTDINTIALGSDYDGTTVPECLKDSSSFPILFEYLLENGYSDQDVKKLASENLLRVFKDTWKN